MSDFDRVESALSRISLLAQLSDKVSVAFKATLPRCGDCAFWMKSRECPREHNVRGYSRGPSSEAFVCDQFRITDASEKHQTQLISDAINFAIQHELPAPAYLLAYEKKKATP